MCAQAIRAGRETDVRAVEAMLRRIEVAENTGDVTEITEMLADDVVIMVPNEPVQEGKAACAAFVDNTIAGLLEEFDRRIAYVSAEVRVLGDCAFDRGTFSFTVTPRAGGDTSRERGKYLFLYSRTADDSWKIARVIVNLDDHEDDGPTS